MTILFKSLYFITFHILQNTWACNISFDHKNSLCSKTSNCQISSFNRTDYFKLFRSWSSDYLLSILNLHPWWKVFMTQRLVCKFQLKTDHHVKLRWILQTHKLLSYKSYICVYSNRSAHIAPVIKQVKTEDIFLAYILPLFSLRDNILKNINCCVSCLI